MADGGLLLQLAHAALLLAAAPLAAGLTRWVRARLAGRRGASPVQPYRDLARALRRHPALPMDASPVSGLAPLVAVAALALAAGLLPPVALHGLGSVLTGPGPIEPPVGIAAAPAPVSGDLVLIAALLGLSRFALGLALLDAGTAAGGHGAARLAAWPALFDPALLVVALCAAALAGAEAAGLDAAPRAAAALGPRAPLLLAVAAVLLVAAVDAPRPPAAGGGSGGGLPHDLGSDPGAPGVGFSGWHLALWDYARALRGTLFLVLVAALLPGPPVPDGVAGLLLGPASGLAEIAVLGALLAAAESGVATLHPDRLPALGAGALALAVVAAAFLLLGGVSA